MKLRFSTSPFTEVSKYSEYAHKQKNTYLFSEWKSRIYCHSVRPLKAASLDPIDTLRHE